MPSLTALGSLQRQVERNASSVLCTFGIDTFTVGDLASLAAACADRLEELGVQEGDRIALMMRNHVTHMVFAYATRWVGAVHVPVSVHVKELGLRTQLHDVQPRLVIADEEFSNLVRSSTAAHDPWRLVVAQEVQYEPKTTFDWPRSAPDDIALIGYTSGTSGPPKGAMLSERFLELGRRTASKLAGIGPEDVIFHWEPFHHLAGWISVHMAIEHGVPLAMVPKFSASRCWDQIRDVGATKLHHLGGVIDLLLAQPERSNDRDHDVSVAWGAAAPAARWREFEDRFGVELREGYGISEAANFATLNIGGPVGSIGRAIDEFTVRIVEPGTDNELPAGHVGEILLEAHDPGLTMRGYFNDPEKTRETFLREGVVSTGDLGYMDAEGWFYYSGRVKDSLRRRGENVSAWEVERVVNAFPAVENSAVLGVDTAIGEQDIKVVVATPSPESFDFPGLIAWCRDQLAYYQVPRFVEAVSDLPYGPTQRVQKSRLSRDTTGCYDADTEARSNA